MIVNGDPPFLMIASTKQFKWLFRVICRRCQLPSISPFFSVSSSSVVLLSGVPKVVNDMWNDRVFPLKAAWAVHFDWSHSQSVYLLNFT